MYIGAVNKVNQEGGKVNVQDNFSEGVPVHNPVVSPLSQDSGRTTHHSDPQDTVDKEIQNPASDLKFRHQPAGNRSIKNGAERYLWCVGEGVLRASFFDLQIHCF